MDEGKNFVEVPATTIDEKEVYIRTIDLLSMEVLRLKTEIEILKKRNTLPNSRSTKQKKIIYIPVLTRIITFYKENGFRDTLKRIFHQFGAGQK